MCAVGAAGQPRGYAGGYGRSNRPENPALAQSVIGTRSTPAGGATAPHAVAPVSAGSSSARGAELQWSPYQVPAGGDSPATQTRPRPTASSSPP